MEFFRDPKIDFLGKRHFFKYVSFALMAIGVLGVAILGIPFGIDFTGGTEIALRFSKPLDIAQVRAVVAQTEFARSEIKTYGAPNQFLIRVQQAKGAGDIAAKLQDAFQKQFPDLTVTVLKADVIGPKVGKELRTDALIALILAVLAILLYVSLRFEFAFALGAVLALVHDVVIAFTWAVIAGQLGLVSLEVNQSTIAAVLTVLGFSINDTVVIFDRIRENREIHRGIPLVQLMNMSINQTLSRTVNTSLTTFLVLLVLTLFGGAVLQGFAFIMLLGIIVGTYSSIYVASALTIWYTERRKAKKKVVAATAT